MANTRPDVILAKGVWTDLYLVTSITVGTPITIVNKGSSTVLVAVATSAPIDERGYPLWAGDANRNFVNVTQGEAGLWVKATDGTGQLFVQEF